MASNFKLPENLRKILSDKDELPVKESKVEEIKIEESRETSKPNRHANFGGSGIVRETSKPSHEKVARTRSSVNSVKFADFMKKAGIFLTVIAAVAILTFGGVFAYNKIMAKDIGRIIYQDTLYTENISSNVMKNKVGKSVLGDEGVYIDLKNMPEYAKGFLKVSIDFSFDGVLTDEQKQVHKNMIEVLKYQKFSAESNSNGLEWKRIGDDFYLLQNGKPYKVTNTTTDGQPLKFLGTNAFIYTEKLANEVYKDVNVKLSIKAECVDATKMDDKVKFTDIQKYFTPSKDSSTLNFINASNFSEQEINYGENVVRIPNAKLLKGEIFKEWNTRKDGLGASMYVASNDQNFLFNITDDMNLYPITTNSITTNVVNGAAEFKVLNNKDEVVDGEDVTFVLTPKDNYNLTYFYINGEDYFQNLVYDEGKNEYTFTYKNVQEPLRAEAYLSLDEYSVVIQNDGNGVVEGAKTVQHGANLNLTITALQANSRLKSILVNGEEYISALDRDVLTIYYVTEPLVIHAKFIDTYDVIIKTDVNGKLSAGKMTYDEGDKVVFSVKEVREGYHLSEIIIEDENGKNIETIDGTIKPYISKPIKSKLIVTPIFEKIEYEITIARSVDGEITALDRVKYGENLKISVALNNGSLLKELNVYDNDDREVLLRKFIPETSQLTFNYANVLNNLYIEGVFEKESYCVTGEMNIQNAGKIEFKNYSNLESQIFKFGDDISINIVEFLGYRLKNVKVYNIADRENPIASYIKLDDKLNYLFRDINCDIVAVAEFVKIYTITLTPNVNGEIITDSVIESGEDLQISVSANEKFKNISLKVLDTETKQELKNFEINLDMPSYIYPNVDRNLTLVAEFEEMWKIEFNENANGKVSVENPKRYYDNNDEITFNVEVNKGYDFTKLIVNDGSTNFELLDINALRYTITSDITVTAVYTIKKYVINDVYKDGEKANIDDLISNRIIAISGYNNGENGFNHGTEGVKITIKAPVNFVIKEVGYFQAGTKIPYKTCGADIKIADGNHLFLREYTINGFNDNLDIYITLADQKLEIHIENLYKDKGEILVRDALSQGEFSNGENDIVYVQYDGMLQIKIKYAFGFALNKLTISNNYSNTEIKTFDKDDLPYSDSVIEFKVTQHLKLSAVYEVRQYDVAIEYMEGTDVSLGTVKPNANKITHNNPVLISTTDVKKGYELRTVKVYECVDGAKGSLLATIDDILSDDIKNKQIYEHVTSHIFIEVYYTKKEFRVNLDYIFSSENSDYNKGTINIKDATNSVFASGEYLYGTKITIYAKGNEGKSIRKFKISDSLAQTVDFTVNSILGNREREYTLTVYDDLNVEIEFFKRLMLVELNAKNISFGITTPEIFYGEDYKFIATSEYGFHLSDITITNIETGDLVTNLTPTTKIIDSADTKKGKYLFAVEYTIPNVIFDMQLEMSAQKNVYTVTLNNIDSEKGMLTTKSLSVIHGEGIMLDNEYKALCYDVEKIDYVIEKTGNYKESKEVKGTIIGERYKNTYGVNNITGNITLTPKYKIKSFFVDIVETVGGVTTTSKEEYFYDEEVGFTGRVTEAFDYDYSLTDYELKIVDKDGVVRESVDRATVSLSKVDKYFHWNYVYPDVRTDLQLKIIYTKNHRVYFNGVEALKLNTPMNELVKNASFNFTVQSPDLVKVAHVVDGTNLSFVATMNTSTPIEYVINPKNLRKDGSTLALPKINKIGRTYQFTFNNIRSDINFDMEIIQKIYSITINDKLVEGIEANVSSKNGKKVGTAIFDSIHIIKNDNIKFRFNIDPQAEINFIQYKFLEEKPNQWVKIKSQNGYYTIPNVIDEVIIQIDYVNFYSIELETNPKGQEANIKVYQDSMVGWYGSVADGFERGNGTKTNPYIIASGNQLAYLSQNVGQSRDKYYKLEVNINFNNNKFTPIGSSSNPFRGYFDGAGHTLKNISIDTSYAALFGYVEGTSSKYAEVSNFQIESGTIKGTSYAASAVCRGEYVKVSKIENRASIVASSSACGIIYSATNVIVDHCKNKGSLGGYSYESYRDWYTTNPSRYGIASNLTNSVVDYVYNSAYISQGNGTGLIGNNKGNVSNAINYGSVSYSMYSEYGGGASVCGLFYSNTGKLTNVQNYGSVGSSFSGDEGGNGTVTAYGICRTQNGDMENVHMHGSVSASIATDETSNSGSSVIGMVGTVNGNVINCSREGSVSMYGSARYYRSRRGNKTYYSSSITGYGMFQTVNGNLINVISAGSVSARNEARAGKSITLYGVASSISGYLDGFKQTASVSATANSSSEEASSGAQVYGVASSISGGIKNSYLGGSVSGNTSGESSAGVTVYGVASSIGGNVENVKLATSVNATSYGSSYRYGKHSRHYAPASASGYGLSSSCGALINVVRTATVSVNANGRGGGSAYGAGISSSSGRIENLTNSGSFSSSGNSGEEGVSSSASGVGLVSSVRGDVKNVYNTGSTTINADADYNTTASGNTMFSSVSGSMSYVYNSGSLSVVAYSSDEYADSTARGYGIASSLSGNATFVYNAGSVSINSNSHDDRASADGDGAGMFSSVGGHMEYVANTGNVYVDIYTGKERGGSAAGIALSAKSMNNCYNTGSVTFDYDDREEYQDGSGRAAGLVVSASGTISNVYNTGRIYCNVEGEGEAGGIVVSGGTIYNAINYGAIDVASNSEERGHSYGGGIAAHASTVKNAINYAAIDVDSDYHEDSAEATAGGIIGSGGSAYYCYNFGSVDAQSDDDDAEAGGIIGSGSSVYNSYNCGAVDADTNEYGADSYGGGIIGRGSAYNSYTIGSVRASAREERDEHCGGVSGRGSSNNSYSTERSEYHSGEDGYELMTDEIESSTQIKQYLSQNIVFTDESQCYQTPNGYLQFWDLSIKWDMFTDDKFNIQAQGMPTLKHDWKVETPEINIESTRKEFDFVSYQLDLSRIREGTQLTFIYQGSDLKAFYSQKQGEQSLKQIGTSSTVYFIINYDGKIIAQRR